MMKLLKRLLPILLFSGSFSCTSTPDPEDIILDVFKVPVENCLRIQNIFNELAMDVNGIVMNNLNFDQDTITEDVAGCLDAVVFRNSETQGLDSIVLDYGSSYCNSNGGRFKGRVLIVPTDQDLKTFDIGVTDFFANGYGIIGQIRFQVNGDVPGKDFAIFLSGGKFFIEGTESAYSVMSSSTYSFAADEVGDDSYVDDIFRFSIDLEGTTPNGVSFTFKNVSELTYAYTCGEIIGGTAGFVLSGIGEGTADFGEGNPAEDCDNDVIIQTKEGTIVTKL